MPPSRDARRAVQCRAWGSMLRADMTQKLSLDRTLHAAVRRAIALAVITTLAACAPYDRGAVPVTEQGSGKDVRWLKADVKGMGALSVAVLKPEGQGPFPAVVILHGTHGFGREYVEIARSLARDGMVAVTGCWFKGGYGAGTSFITPIECSDAPPLSAASSDTAFLAVSALVDAARKQPEVRADRIALFGHSRGGGAALEYFLRKGGVQALVLNSAGYSDEIIGKAPQITVPVLMLHGTADSPADGGSAMTDIQRARRFAEAIQPVNKSVEVVYYRGSPHNGFFSGPKQHQEEMQRIGDFLHRHLFQ